MKGVIQIKCIIIIIIIIPMLMCVCVCVCVWGGGLRYQRMSQV